MYYQEEKYQRKQKNGAKIAIIRIMNRRTIFIRMKSVHKTAANDNVQSLKPALYNLLMWIIYLKGCDIRKLC